MREKIKKKLKVESFNGETKSKEDELGVLE